MRKIQLILLLSSFVCCLSSCIGPKRSKITSDLIKPGMSKKNIIAKLGNPYKEDYHYDKDSSFIEHLYYKEKISLKDDFWVTTILDFKNGILAATKQGEERRVNYNGGTDGIENVKNVK